jgi:hypothetical protein
MCGLLAFASDSLLYIHHPTPTMIVKIIIPIKRGANNSMRNTIATGFVRQLLKSSSNQWRSSLAERNGPGGI